MAQLGVTIPTIMSAYDDTWQSAKTNAIKAGLSIVEHGWEQHVIIDEKNSVVYRYPRNESAANKLADEVGVLGELASTDWPVQIPHIIDHTEKFTSYKYIDGDVLDEKNIALLNEDDMARIGTSLGRFLTTLHSASVDIIHHKKTKQTQSLLEYYTDRIELNQSSKYYRVAHDALHQLLSAAADTPSNIVVHGDLHGLNMVVDMDSRCLQGVIDFSELEIGSPEQDFRKIFMADQRLLAPAIESYCAINGQSPREEVIKLWAFVNEWANICYFSHRPSNATYKRALHHLQRWGQV